MKRHIPRARPAPKPSKFRLALKAAATVAMRAAFALRLADREKFLRTEAGRKIAEFQAVINRLTNWQYCRWVRAGAPGRDKKDVSKVEPFTRLVHP